MRFGSMVVTADDTRSNGGFGVPTKCFYCNAEISAQHSPECVCLKRAVVVRVTMEAVIVRPQSWDAGNIEFHLNDSSWCANNFFDDLTEEETSCLCGHVRFDFMRDAEPDDLRQLPIATEEGDRQELNEMGRREEG